MAKVILKKKQEAPEEVEVVEQKNLLPPKIRCPFCDSALRPSYTDSATLKKYLSDRARIVSKQRSRLCSKHQRQISREIKRARFLGLLPYIASV